MARRSAAGYTNGMPQPTRAPVPAEPGTETAARETRTVGLLGPRGVQQAQAVQRLQRSPRQQAQRQVMQRAIGLEIEVPVPIDALPPEQTLAIENLAGPPGHDAPLSDRIQANARRQQHGKAPYGTLCENEDLRVDIDHDDRVKTPDPYGTGWPMPEGGVDSIIEIVTKPAERSATFDRRMDAVDTLVADIQGQTANLTRHWAQAWGTALNVGPLDYTRLGRPAARQPQHNFDGSVQVNLGLGLSGYGDMLETYAQSTYADPQRAAEGERQVFEDANQHLQAAVDAGRSVADALRTKHAKKLQPEHNDLKGIEGWITHVALYLIRGSAQGVGGTQKNLAPVLMKTPSSIATERGMSEAERDFYAANLNGILTAVLEAVNRHKDAKWFGRWKARPVFPGQAQDQGGDLSIGELARPDADRPPLTGKPIDTPGAEGNDLVAEFRTLPGYHQPDAWRQLGHDFLRTAKAQKKRR
jgi:hypothetical protein